MLSKRAIIISTIALAIGPLLWAYGVYIIPNQPIHKQDFLAGVGEAFLGVAITIIVVITLAIALPIKISYARSHPKQPANKTTPTTVNWYD